MRCRRCCCWPSAPSPTTGRAGAGRCAAPRPPPTPSAWPGRRRWRAGLGLYVAGLVAYQLTLTYSAAAFPGLARHAPPAAAAADERERSRLSNVALALQSLGEVLMLAAAAGLARALAGLVAFAAACWLALSLPWFVLERPRPGRRLPPGAPSLLAAGLRQLRDAAALLHRLRQTLVYLVGYFLLGDALTTVTLVAALQNRVVAYRPLTLTLLLLAGVAAQAVGVAAFWLLQRRLALGARPMFNAVAVAIVALDAWGLAGNWTGRFGFRHHWEVWLYQAFYGLCVCPWYSYSQIVLSSVTPPGHEFLFFSLFNVAGKASSFVGPFISSAIIDASSGPRRDSAPFYFLFALSLASALFLYFFLDLDRSAREQEAFLADERARLRRADAAPAAGRGDVAAGGPPRRVQP